MCRYATVVRFLRPVAVAGVFFCIVSLGMAQESGMWKRIAGTAVSQGLASPASGPVEALWYAAGTGNLMARTSSGRVFETGDFAQWKLNTAGVPGAARMQTSAGRLFSQGEDNIFASDDGGRSWMNLTGFNGRSVIGGGFTSLALSPSNPLEVAVANRFGVWRSLDGGLTWRGLNDTLPNLAARKLTGTRTLALADNSILELNAGMWIPATASDPEQDLILRYSNSTHFSLSAAARAASIAYAGSRDGQLLASRNDGASWMEAPRVPAVSQIDRIWIDSERPETALAAAGSRLLRTINGGLFWDDVTGPLSAGAIHGVTADRSAGVIYIATDRGVFSATFSLNDAGPGASRWIPVGGELPAAPAWDVRLNPDNTLTVVLDGYGVFETVAPHRTRRVRVVNAADMSDKAAAPGSLITVLGANITAARAAGMLYPVLASSDRSSQVQVPFETVAGTWSLALDAAGARWTVPLAVKDAAPAIFVDSDGAPLILEASSGLVMDPNVAVRAASSLQLMATGLGKVSPEWPTGVAAPLENPPAVTAAVTAFLDGTPVKVTRAVLAPGYVGYYLVELQVPAIVNRGASELRIVVNGEESNRVRLYLESDLAR